MSREQMQRSTFLQILRNPHGWSEESVREARLWAADELERLEGEKAAHRFHISIASKLIELGWTPPPKPRCSICNYQHGHSFGCEKNPVNIALKGGVR